jgi:ABC-2 type transport system permease protein
MARLQSLRELYLTRLREFYRQPARIFWVYGFPTILAFCLGLAFRSQPPEATHVDLITNAASDSIVAALKPNSRIILDQFTEAEAEKRLKTGKTALVVEPTSSGGVTYRYDNTRPEAVTARAAFDDALQRAKGRKDVVPTSDSLVKEPGSRYVDFLIPGLIGLNTMGGGLWGVGFLLVNFRLGKLLKRFSATPMPRENFLLAILGARLTFLIPDCGVLLLLGWGYFGMPIRGSILAFVAVELMGALAFAGIGLLVGSRVKTTETVSGLMNLIMLPMWLFSGVFFSSSNFPGWLQPVIQVLPLTQLTSGLRMILLEGAGLESMAILRALAILTAWSVGTFWVALRIFRWQ